MNSLDYKIVRELQRNARLTNQELSENVGLSPSPCLRRVRLLESSGILKGYTAIVDQEEYGLPITAFVLVRLDKQTKFSIQEFENGINRLDSVMSCYLMSGSFDYLLKVLSPSLKEYERFIRDELTKIPVIGALETHFVFGHIKQSNVYPIPLGKT